MKILRINETKCIKCLKCVNECPSNLFYKPETIVGQKRRVIFEDKFDRCISCGHCISICPTDAIEYDAIDTVLEFEEVKKPSLIITYENLIKFLKSRRSIRNYKKEPVSRENIEAVLQAIRYAPSAGNRQSWEFIVLTDEQKIADLRKIVMKMFYTLEKLIKLGKYFKFFLSKDLKERINAPGSLISMKWKIERYENQQDPVFFDAPVVIILYAPKYGNLTDNDAGICLTQGILAAQSLNLGTCWIGYAQEALRRNKKYRKKLTIPKNMNVHGVLALGVPNVEYYRTVPRNPLKVKWN